MAKLFAPLAAFFFAQDNCVVKNTENGEYIYGGEDQTSAEKTRNFDLLTDDRGSSRCHKISGPDAPTAGRQPEFNFNGARAHVPGSFF